jgi:hypothetical protein
MIIFEFLLNKTIRILLIRFNESLELNIRFEITIFIQSNKKLGRFNEIVGNLSF